MSTPYFSKFPKTTYDVLGTDFVFKTVTDIIHRDRFIDAVLNSAVIMFPYTIKDGETPDIIAEKLYGAPTYFWLILFANNIFNLWSEWPLSYDQFIATLTKKYGSPSIAQSTIHHYQDKYGNIIDLDSYNATISDGSISVSLIDFETSVNEAKRQIQLVDPQFVNAIESELDRLLNS